MRNEKRKEPKIEPYGTLNVMTERIIIQAGTKIWKVTNYV